MRRDRFKCSFLKKDDAQPNESETEVAVTITKIIDCINVGLAKNESIDTVMANATRFLMGNLGNLSKQNPKKITQFIINTPMHKLCSLESVLDTLKRLGSEFGVDVTIEDAEPEKTETLIRHYNSGLYAKYPNANTDPNDYLKCLLDRFIRLHAQNNIEIQFVLRYKLVVHEARSKGLYNKIHRLLTEFDYKSRFPEKMLVGLSRPIINLMRRHGDKKLTEDEFANEVEKLFQAYLNPTDNPELILNRDFIKLKFLFELQRIVLSSKDLSNDLSTHITESKEFFLSLPNYAGGSLLMTIVELDSIKEDYEKFKKSKDNAHIVASMTTPASN